MRVLISAEGQHDPANCHLMMVDGFQLLLDLSNVQGTLHDPTIRKVEWGPVVLGGEVRDGGTITRADGHKQRFFDVALLKPYLTAWQARRDEFDTRSTA